MATSARIDELQKKFNENPRRYFAPLADEYRKAGDLTTAIELCRSHLAQQPGHMSGHIVLGKALYEGGQFDEARGTFETALGLDPENLIALRHLGDIARQQGDPQGARGWYQRVLDADPRNDEIAEQIAALESEREPASTGTGDPALPPALADAPDTLAESTVADGTLPPALEPSAIAYLAEEPTLEVPAFRGATDAVDLDLGAIEAAPPAAAADTLDFSDDFAAPAAPAAPANDLGLESMEFVAPTGDDRGARAEGLDRPEYDFDPHVVDGSMGGDATPAAFVTETMAELYLQQGFRDEALQVYRQLLAASPGDANLRARVQQLETGGRSTLAFEVSEDVVRAAQERQVKATRRSARRFFGGLAARRAPLRDGGHAGGGAASGGAMDADHADAMPADALPADAYAYGPTGVDTSAMDAQAFVEPHAAHEPAAGEQHAPDDAATFDTQAYETTGRDAQSPEAPGYDAPAYDARGYDAQGYGAQGYDTQAYDAAAYDAQGYDAQAYDAQPHDAPGYETREYESPSTDGPAGQEFPEATTEGQDAHAPSAGEWGGADQASMPPAESEFDVSAYELGTWEQEASAPEPAPSPLEPPPPPPVSARGLTPSGGQGVTGTVDALFGGAATSADDEAAAEALAGAFNGTPAAIPAVRPAKSELSLDQVFRETPRRSESQRRESSAFSFDQFFSEGQGAPPSSSTPPSNPPAAPPGQGGDNNDEQFNAWLEGLKQK